MAYLLRCADSGMDYPGQFQTRPEDELMKHVQLYVGEAHPDTELTPGEHYDGVALAEASPAA